MTSAQIAASAPRTGVRQLLIAAAIAAAIAAVANLIVYVIAGPIAGVPLEVQPSPDLPRQAVGPIAVILASAVPAFAAAGLLWVLGRFLRQPLPVFLIISAAFLLFSLFPVFSMPVPLSNQIALAVMHLVAGVAIVGTLYRATAR